MTMAFTIGIHFGFVVTCMILALQCSSVHSAEVHQGEDKNFTCFTCSYASPGNNGMDCINNTNYVRVFPGYSVKCGNYCVTSQIFDKETRRIKSLFRTCSVFWGNDCIDDPSVGSINCKTSCKGDYCNNITISENRIESLCEQFHCDNMGLSFFNLDLSVTIFIIGFSVFVTGFLS